MIQMQTRLDVADNTGAKEVMCFKVLGGSALAPHKRRVAGLGDIIIASVKKASSGGDVKAGDVVRCVVVRTSATRPAGPTAPTSRFDRNAVAILIDTEKNPRGTQIFGIASPGEEAPRARQFLEDPSATAAEVVGPARSESETQVMHIRKDDMVVVTAGDDKGSEPRKVLRALPKAGKIVQVGREPRLQAPQAERCKNQQGRLSKEMPIDASNTSLLYCPTCRREGVRVGHRCLHRRGPQRSSTCKTGNESLGHIGPAKAARAKSAK